MGSNLNCKELVASRSQPDRPVLKGLPTAGEDYRFLRGLIDGMRCGIVAVDRQGRLAMMNDLGAQILELTDRPAAGTPVGDAFSDHPQLAQVLLESFEMSSLPNRAEIELRLRDNRTKTLGFTLSMIPGSESSAAGAAIFFKDLTQIEHKEEQDRLRDRLAALGQMAASLAHEIRNPLASIEVICSLLRRRLQSEDPGRELLDKITSEVRRLNQTITSSLEFVRPIAIELKRAELQPVLEEAIAVAVERAGETEIRIVRKFRDGLVPFMMDREQLRQVFENLIINAVEAIGESGTVTVETELVPAPSGASIPYRPRGAQVAEAALSFDSFVVVRITDNGPGIDREDLDRVFYPFFTTKKQGSGVGLSMAKKIVDRHRGLIDVATAPEGGAEFNVRLPVITSVEEG